MTNSEIANILKELADLLEIKGENPFKIRAYRNAAIVIESLGQSIEKLVEDGVDLTKLSGIGEHIAQKIKEIVETKTLKKLEKLKKEIPPSLLELLSIEGLGAKRVKVLYDKLNVKNLKDLQEAALEHKVSKLYGFGLKTEENIIKGIKLLKQEGIRFLYSEAEFFAKDIEAYLNRFSKTIRCSVAGSFRRCKESVGDLDFICSSNEPKSIIDYFLNYEYISFVIVSGDTKASIVLKNSMQVDLRVIQDKSYGSALHYFTGSKSHVIKLRQMALDIGLNINEYGIFKEKENIASSSENEVYKALGLKYIPPQLRENRGEIEAAKIDKLPNLIEPKDIKGDLHMHTNYSDGINSILDMATKAKNLGYEYIAITDHNATLSVANGLDTARALKYFEEIDEISSKLDIKIFKGLEVDILEDGSINLDKTVIEKSDLLIGAIHSKFKLSKQQQTKRIIKALQNKNIKAIAHISGRIIGKREPIELSFSQIFKVASAENKAIEINSQPTRLDLNDIYAKVAKDKYGVKFIISSDAHSTKELDYIKYGICQAKRAWLEKSDVLNTLSLKEFKKFLIKG